jgi:hypothetical protein
MPVIFLDIDGVLLRRHVGNPSGFELAPHAETFLAYLVGAYEVKWLTTRCRHGLPNDVTRAFRHAMQVITLPPSLAALIDKVSPGLWSRCKTEALDLTTDFYWLDDQPTPTALQVLAQHGRLDRWIEVRVDDDPDDLLRVRRLLDEGKDGVTERRIAVSETGLISMSAASSRASSHAAGRCR